MSNFSETQLVALAWIPRCTSLLSVMGSSAIIYVIASAGRQKLCKTYHRILLCMSLMDWMQSAAHAFSTAPIPANTEGVHGAMGNVDTCTVQGFFMAAGYAVPMYNVVLSFYYLMATLDKRWPSKCEPYFHLISLGLPLSMAVSGVIGEEFNNLGTICFYNEYPLKCSSRDGVECTRGLHAHIYISILGVFLLTAFIIIPTNMMILYIIVARQQNIMRKNYFHMSKPYKSHISNKHRNNMQCNATYTSSVHNNHNQETKPSKKERYLSKIFNIEKTRDRQVAFQALCYVISFMLTFATTVIDAILWVYAPDHRNFTLVIISKIFYPMQGLFNFLIFIRPRTDRIARQHPNVWYPCILIKAVFDKGSHARDLQQRRHSIQNHHHNRSDPHHISPKHNNHASNHNDHPRDSSREVKRRDSLNNVLNLVDAEGIIEYNHTKQTHRDSLNIIDCSDALQRELMELCISDDDDDDYDDKTSETKREKESLP